MQCKPPDLIDVQHTITSLALLLIGAALLDREPGGAVEVLCDEPGLADDLVRVFPDWSCEGVRRGGQKDNDCCVLTLRKNLPT